MEKSIDNICSSAAAAAANDSLDARVVLKDGCCVVLRCVVLCIVDVDLDLDSIYSI